jgi:hypothetical protein
MVCRTFYDYREIRINFLSQCITKTLYCMYDVFHVSILHHYILDSSHVLDSSNLQVSNKGTLNSKLVSIVDQKN